VGDDREVAVPVGLASAADVDGAVRALLRELLALPDVRRAGVALVEGGGRRLRFLPATDEGAAEWCHIDAYDDVPLTAVVRAGGSVCGDLDSFGGRYAGLVAAQRDQGTEALAAFALPGASSPVGGLLVYYARRQAFDTEQRDALTTLARHAGDAVRRVRARGVRIPSGRTPVEPDAAVLTASLALTDEPTAARAARRFLRGTLAGWGVGEAPIETAELCVSELVTNAVIHADATSELTVSLDDGMLTVAVRDHGGAGDEAALPVEDDDPMRVFGRGLVLVEALSDSWGAERDEVGTTSWFVLDLPDDARSAAS
jgi:anti-sigma regulatory factor (Ser/Thr protein kinase)